MHLYDWSVLLWTALHNSYHACFSLAILSCLSFPPRIWHKLTCLCWRAIEHRSIIFYFVTLKVICLWHTTLKSIVRLLDKLQFKYSSNIGIFCNCCWLQFNNLYYTHFQMDRPLYMGMQLKFWVEDLRDRWVLKGLPQFCNPYWSPSSSMP